ncbi:Universal stress protein A-like protein [Arachis hypogaea]|nr:Universal stress protein A-like protein [Arachis hypogaea]
MEKKEQKIMVAVDQSEESMHALSWCLSNLISDTNKKKLLLLHVKPPPAICSFDTAGYVFSPEVIAAMEKYSMELANSVMDKAEAICRNLNATDVISLFIQKFFYYNVSISPILLISLWLCL